MVLEYWFELRAEILAAKAVELGLLNGGSDFVFEFVLGGTACALTATEF